MSQKMFIVGNMDCANCAKEVETGVSRLVGVESVRVDFATSKMTVSGDVTFEVLKSRVEALGKTLATGHETKPSATVHHGAIGGFVAYLISRSETRLALIGGVLTILTLLLSILTSTPDNASAVLYTTAMSIALYSIARSGLNTLRINHEFNINLLMTIAAIGAIVIGEYLEASTVIFLFAVGEALEGYTAERARRSISSLMSLKPAQAILISDEGEVVVSVEALRVGDRLRVKPGERIPMDGEIVSGESSVNQATITGESLPVYKAMGDEVFAGTLNVDGSLEMRVTRLAKDNTLSRIIALVEEAQSVRAPSQRLIDRFAHYYTPTVTILALLVALVPPLAFNAPFYDTPDGHGWLYRALSMLVIACPCALVISTPVTVISAITAAARQGVLIKGGVHLETLGQVDAIAFDKTGTLTIGKPTVKHVHAVDCVDPAGCENCDEMLALAAAVECHSTHPLAQAIMQASQSHQMNAVYQPAASVKNLAGQGIQGQVAGDLVTVGSHRLFDEQFAHTPEFCALIDAVEHQGQTTVMVHDGAKVRGYISVADAIRDSSRDVVQALNKLGIKTIMLTGDNKNVAQRIAAEIGVTDVRAELMPADKVTAIRQMADAKYTIAMVGDGINDTPALAAANVGIAMGGAGSAQALETADIALIADDLRQLPFAISLSRFARMLIKQNVSLTFVVKLTFLILAFMGMTSLWVAVLADVGMSLLVTLNGMRPLRRI